MFQALVNFSKQYFNHSKMINTISCLCHTTERVYSVHNIFLASLALKGFSLRFQNQVANDKSLTMKQFNCQIHQLLHTGQSFDCLKGTHTYHT